MHRALRRKIAILMTMDTADVSKATEAVKRKLDRLKKFGVAAFKAVAVAAAAVTAAMGFVLKGVVETGMQFEKFGVQLKVLTGSAKSAEQAFSWIKGFAATTPFELSEVVNATVMLKAFGIEAKDYLKDIGDLAAGMQTDLEFVVDAFGRLASGQTGEAFEKFRRLGITARTLMDEGIKFTSGNQLVSSTQEALIAIQRIVQRRFGGMMEEQSKTMAGIITNIKDIWTQFQGLISDVILPTFKKDLDRIRQWMSDALASGELKRRATEIGNKILEIYAKLKEILPRAAQAAKDLWDFFSPMLKWIADNPNVVKNAVIVAVFVKATTLAASLLKTVKEIGTVVAGSSLFKGLLARAGGTVAGGAAGGVMMNGLGQVVGGASAGAAGLFGGIATSTIVSAIIPVVLGVLAAGVVALAIKAVAEGVVGAEKDRKRETRIDSGKYAGLPKYNYATGRLNTDAELSILHSMRMAEQQRKMDMGTISVTAQDTTRNPDAERSAGIADYIREKQLQPLIDEYTDARFKLSMAGASEFDQQRKEIDKKYDELFADIASKISLTGGGLLLQDAQKLIQDTKAQRDLEMGLVGDKEAFEKAKERKEKVAELEKEYSTRTLDIQKELYLSQFAQMDEFTQRRESIFIESQQRIAELQEMHNQGMLSAEEMKHIQSIELQQRADEIKLVNSAEAADKAMKLEEKKQEKIQKIQAKAMSLMNRIEGAYVGQRLSLQKAASVAIIQTVSEELTTELKMRVAAWAAKALAAQASFNFWSAAKYAAAIAAAGVGSALISEGARSITDSIIGKGSGLPSSESFDTGSTGGGGSRNPSAVTSRGQTTIYLNPSLSITGEIVVIGESGGIEAASEAFANASLRITKDAIETGELSMDSLGG